METRQEAYERLEDDGGAGKGSGAKPELIEPRAEIAPEPSLIENRGRERYKYKLYHLGITECVLGGLSLILAVATLSVDVERISSSMGLDLLFTYTSQGIWDGVMIAITGVLGILAKKNPSVAMYNANMVFGIITAVCSAPAIVLSGFASLFSFGFPTYELAVLHITISLLLLCGFIIAIVHSAFCCAGVCGSSSRNSTTVMFIPQPYHPQQVCGHQQIQYVATGGVAMPEQFYLQPGQNPA